MEQHSANHPAGSTDSGEHHAQQHPAYTWVVVADASGADVFGYKFKSDSWKPLYHLDFDGNGAPQSRDFGTKASMHKGALHAHGASTQKETYERHLAHAIAHALERGLADKSFEAVVLVATPKLLGELRENLDRGLRKLVVAEVHKDYRALAPAALAQILLPQLPL
jgi:protein required for attachment to host cells